jgi:3-isopropylmalate dehydrogenase
MRLKITVLPGDGVGPEVTREAVRVLRAVGDVNGYDFQFDEHPIGGEAIRRDGAPLPASTLEACLQSDAVLLGAVGTPAFDSLPREQKPEAGLLQLRRTLGCYANLRPVIAHDPLLENSPLKAEVVRGSDVLIVRELLGGIYFGEPRGLGPGRDAFNTMRYSAREIERIAHVAFRLAHTRRRKVTSVDKANVLETSQLWRQIVTRVALEYPDVKLEHMYVDSCSMRLVTDPTHFDVVLTENLFGDILSDEAAVMTGSLGMLASASVGGKVDLYEPVHGSAPDIAGRNLANPLGAIASAAMLLRHTAKLEEDAQDVEAAIAKVLRDGYRTADLARGCTRFTVTTSEMGSLVENALADVTQQRHAYHAV